MRRNEWLERLAWRVVIVAVIVALAVSPLGSWRFP